MDLRFRKPSQKARSAICDYAMEPLKNTQEILKEIKENIIRITGHEKAEIVNSGNAALMIVMSNLPGPFLIPDEGGWRGFKQIPGFLGKRTIILETRLGLINPDELEDKLENKKPSALFLTSFAGYTAEQPLKEIYDICSKNDVILVEDASGSVGDPEGKLCNGKYSHVIVASTGSPKVVNAGAGGFISTSIKGFLESGILLKTLKPAPYILPAINEELKIAPQTLKKMLDACKYLKENLSLAFHKKKRGINVIIPSRDPKLDVKRLRREIKVEGGNIFTVCPSYDRIKRRAIAVEIKNLDISCLIKENMDELIDLLEEKI